MYHHPARHSLTSDAADRLARRLKLVRAARERARRGLPSRDQRSPFGPIAKAARVNGAPHVPAQRVAMDDVRFPRQRTGENKGGRDA